jgi:hypothetical protein
VVDGCLFRPCSRYESKQKTKALRRDNAAAMMEDHDRKPGCTAHNVIKAACMTA